MVLITALVFIPLKFILCLLRAGATTATPPSNLISTESITSRRDNLGFTDATAIDDVTFTRSPAESKISTYGSSAASLATDDSTFTRSPTEFEIGAYESVTASPAIDDVTLTRSPAESKISTYESVTASLATDDSTRSPTEFKIGTYESITVNPAINDVTFTRSPTEFKIATYESTTANIAVDDVIFTKNPTESKIAAYESAIASPATDDVTFTKNPIKPEIYESTTEPLETTTLLDDGFSSPIDRTLPSTVTETTNNESTIVMDRSYEFTNELPTTVPTSVSTDDGSSSPSTVDWTTRTEGATTVDDATSTDSTTTTTTIDPTACNPAWPANASEDTREIVGWRINDTSTDWIALSWESPCDSATNASITYSVERCDDENFCFPTNETNTWHNATDLDSCTRYTFTVRILTDYWESDGVNVSATTNTISSIDDVVNLSVRSVGINVIQLVWQAPADHARCISNYSIDRCNETSCDEITVTATNYTASDLEPCTEYNFTVKTVTPTAESAGLTETVRTTSPKLSEPTRCQIVPGNFSLNVTWEPPPMPDNCLKHYRVSVDKFSENTTKTQIVVPNLHACMEYQVSISAVNVDDVMGDTFAENATTLPYSTLPPKLVDPNGILPNETNLTTYWSIDKENNHCELRYLRVACNSMETHGKRHCHVNKTSSKEIDPKSASKRLVFENVTVLGLSPFTNYTCLAFTLNSGGSSNITEVNATTLEDVPDPPNCLDLYDITDSQFSLSWKEPECPHGNLQEFQIKITWAKRYPIPKWCAEEKSGTVFEPTGGSTFNYNYRNATAFTSYEVRIKARTGTEIRDGWGSYSDSKHCTTGSGIPEAVTRFNSSSIIIKPNSTNPNTLDTILTWGLPCSLRGELEVFNVSVHGTRDGFTPHSFSIRHKCERYIHNDHMCSLNLNELKGEYNYSFAISAKVKNVDTLGEPTEVTDIQYPAGIPPRPDKNYIEKITVDPYKLSRSTTTATVYLPLFTNENGIVKYYAVMVSKMGSNEPTSTRFDLKSKIWPNTSSWEEATGSDFAITYQATRRNWDPSDHIVDYDNVEAVMYTIGEDTTCKNTKKKYCNGPLKPDTWYHVRMRAFTSGGYSDSDYFVIRTNAELNLAVVIGAVFGILFTGILVTMMLLVRKCSPYLVLRRFLHSDMPGSPVPAPFTRKKFVSHCQQLIDNPGKLSNEFRLLQTLSVDLQMPTNTACLQANRKKNRYSDILPYDFSRVKLEVIDNDPNTDYINASFIKGYTGEDEYIACQGPKEETTYDFWRMVDQYNINIIVMLTQLVEKDKEKCHQYYPAIRETFRYENMTIRCTSELDFRTHTQRTLVLQKEKEKRSITHLHFKDWPDHDVPEDFDAMINFCQIMRRNISANKGFIVVHCSAGIGRTGTLIAIDILLQHLRDNRKLDVFGTVYRLRHHRINMVQRESQYAYIYNCIKQVLKNPYFLKTYKPPPVEPIYENVPKKVKDTTNTDINLVNNLELLPKKYNSFISMESLTMESIYDLFSWSKPRRTTINNGLRHYKSMSAIHTTTHSIATEQFQTLDCIYSTHFSTGRVFTETVKDSSNKSSRESLMQESIPLLTSKQSPDVPEGSTQHATNGEELLKSTENAMTRIFNATTAV